MARFYRDSDVRLDDQIRTAEAKLHALYAKRAGRRNSRAGETCYGWIYCACGRTNQSDGYPRCEHCDGSDAQAAATLRAHDAGEHALAPLDDCIECGTLVQS